MSELIVSAAKNSFDNGDFKKSLILYEKLADLIGEEFFSANIRLCKKKLNINFLNEVNINKVIDDEKYLKLLQGAFSSFDVVDSEWIDRKKKKIGLHEFEVSKDFFNEFSRFKDQGKKEVFWKRNFWNAVFEKKINKFLEVVSVAGDDGFDIKNIYSSELMDFIFYCKENGFNKEAFSVCNALAYKVKSKKVMQSLYWLGYKNYNINSARNALKEIANNKFESEKWILEAKSRLDKVSDFDVIKKALNKKGDEKYCFNNKKIAYFLHNTLPYSSGGYATRGHGLAQGLKSNGCNIICVSRPGYPHDIPGDSAGKDLPEHDIVEGVDYYRIFSPLRAGMDSNAYMIESAKAIKNFLSKHKIEIVLAASNHVTAIPAGMAARELGIPFFYEVRGFWEITRLSREPEFEKSKLYLNQVRNETEAAINADAVFTLTTPMMEELARRGVAKEKITLLPNSCDPSRFTPRSRDIELARKLNIPDDVPVIGYIGSFVQYEGLENLAQACSILLGRGLDFRLLLVGNENASGSERGPITEEILRIAKEEGLASKLIMPGRVPHEDVEAYYSLIDIAPFPRKPQLVCEMVSPMKPLEALAMEKAVLVSSVRALAEMIEIDKTGLQFAKGDITDMADKIEHLIRNPKLRKDLGVAGRRWVIESRTWDKTSLLLKNKIFNQLEIDDFSV